MVSTILTLNAGSSSLKFSLWNCEAGTEPSDPFRAEFEKIKSPPG
jgi:acetate kinase